MLHFNEWYFQSRWCENGVFLKVYVVVKRCRWQHSSKGANSIRIQAISYILKHYTSLCILGTRLNFDGNKNKRENKSIASARGILPNSQGRNTTYKHVVPTTTAHCRQHQKYIRKSRHLHPPCHSIFLHDARYVGSVVARLRGLKPDISAYAKNKCCTVTGSA